MVVFLKIERPDCIFINKETELNKINIRIKYLNKLLNIGHFQI